MLTSPHECNPHDIKFNNSTRSFEQEINKLDDIKFVRYNADDSLFNIGNINRKIINSVVISSVNSKQSTTYTNNNISFKHNFERALDISIADIILPNLFQSSKKHSDVFAEDLSDRWYIIIAQAKKDLE